MRRSLVRAALAVLLGGAALAPASAHATGFTDIGEDIRAQTETHVSVTGTFRVRGEALYDLDLDRGPTPSGQLLYPLPLSNPSSHLISAADMRLQSDISFYAPFASVAVKARVDAPDNLVLGGTPDGIPGGSATQVPTAALRIRRIYGEALTPIGLLAAGRMGSTWGLGILTNGGDCVDCDSGDAADRIAFITPIGGFIWAASFDFSATGPTANTASLAHVVDVDPTTDVRTVTLAFLKWKDDASRERRLRAGKSTFNLGAYASYRWQQNDVPATYLPLATPVPITATQVMYRGYQAAAFDVWARLVGPKFHVEAEGAVLLANVAQPSLIPGVLLKQPLTALQVGAALESEFGAPEDAVTFGVDAGYASGNNAPGFGVNTAINAPQAKPGDLVGLADQRPEPPGQRLPLPLRLSHRSHPLPRDHRHRHRRGLRPAAPALEHRPARAELALGRGGGHRLGGRVRRVDARAEGAAGRRDRSHALLRRARRLRGRSGARGALPAGGPRQRPARAQGATRAAHPAAPHLLVLAMRRELAATVLLLAAPGCAPDIAAALAPNEPADAGAYTCLPNLDGVIDFSELQPTLNTPVDYDVSPPGVTRTVDLATQVDASGNNFWDFSQSFASDVTVTIAASPLNSRWYQASFPSGQWSAPLDVADTLEGVYSTDSQAIYLLGAASTTESPSTGKTLLVYGEPVAIYRFPLQVGSVWVSTGTVQGGMINGLPYDGTDTYAVADDATGEMNLPAYVFTQVHRVRTTVTQTPSAGKTQVTQQTSFLFECFGEIVRATSELNETNENFTTAAEVRRLASQ